MKKKSYDEIFLYYSAITLLMFLNALNYNLFINPGRIVGGGTSGISVITDSLFGWNPSIVILIVSVAILILALIFKEYEMFRSALYASIIFPLFVELTVQMAANISVDYSNLFLTTIYASVISGIISGIFCKFGWSQGGIILISQIICKKLKKDVSTFNFILNCLIVLVGGISFGVNCVLYSIIYLYGYKVVMNKIILGISEKKMFYIITKEEKLVEDYIVNVLDKGFTTFNATGGFKYKKRSVIMTTISNNDYFKLKEGIKKIDDKAFFIVTDAYQVLGGK